MPVISVLVVPQDPSDDLVALLRSLDAQTAPSSAFQTIVVDASAGGSAARLAEFAARRPNVLVVQTAPDSTAPQRVRSAIERADGALLLALGSGMLLTPRALELIGRAAEATRADVVLGRIAGAELDPAAPTATSAIAAVQRDLLGRLPDAAAALLDIDGVVGDTQGAPARVASVRAAACAVPTPQPQAGVPTGSATFRWHDGTLRLRVDLPVAAGEAPTGCTVLLRRGPAEAGVAAGIEVEPGGARAIVTAEVDPRTADEGDPLADGEWRLLLRIRTPAGVAITAVPRGGVRAALLDGRPVVLHTSGRTAVLDVGATTTCPTGTVPPAGATVTESVAGTRVVLPQPDLHVHGDGVLDGRVLLDRFSLPARLVAADGRAAVEAYVGSLAGTAVVRTAFGAADARTGLQLHVDGEGGMTFTAVPRATAPTPPPPNRVQRLRRRVPSRLDPVARRLRDVAVLRAAYRRLIGR